MTQCEQIKKYLQTHKKPITGLDGLRLFGTLKLATRISELKRDGMLIQTEMIKVKVRKNKFVYVASYKLIH